MKILRIIVIMLLGFAVIEVAAQKSTLKPVGMQHMSTPNSGSENTAHIEIEFSDPVEGAKVVKDSQNSSPDESIASTSTTLHANAIALDKLGKYAKKVTVTHPDFDVCVIDFASLGFTENLKAGEHYKIQVEVPGALLVEANRAFDNLEFDIAKIKYQQYLDDPESKDANIATQRLAIIEELRSPVLYIKNNELKTDKEAKFKKMKAMQMIYDRTHSRKAYDRYLKYRVDLYGQTKRSSLADDGVTELEIDTIFLKANDNRPMSDNKLPHVDGAPYYSWINVYLNLDDAIFKGGSQFADAEMVDGAYRLYVPKGKDAIDVIEIHQADCAPLTIPFTKFGIDSIKPASVYEVHVKVPHAAIIEADRIFGNLDFHTAKNLYEEIISKSDTYDDETISTAQERLGNVTRLVNNDTKKRWDELRKIVDLKGGPIDRDELCRKCIETATLAEEMARLNVPGMQRRSKFYRDLAQNYKTSVFLTINAKLTNDRKEPQLDKKGNFVPFPGKYIVLEFDKVGYQKDVQVWLEAKSKGVFKAYLPKNISRWLLDHPDESLKVTPKQYDNSRKLQKIGEDFEIGLQGGDRAFSIQLFLKNKQN